MHLPEFILLKSNDNNKFLRYRKEEDSNHAFLQFSQDEADQNAEIQYLKFELQMAKTIEGLFHVRSCYNNKYWVRKSADTNWLVAEANEPEEDQSKWSCTLFKPIPVDADENALVGQSHTEPQKIRLVHIDQLGQHYTRVAKTGDDRDFDLVAGDQDSEYGATRSYGDVFTVYNARSFVTLPDYIVLKGHTNQYAAITTRNGVPCLEFKANHIGATGTSHIVTQYPLQQQMFVRNISTQRFWVYRMFGSGFIVVEATTASTSLPNTMFSPIRLGGDFIAIRSVGSNMFGECIRSNWFEHVIGAIRSTINEYAMFKVGEPVLLREISNVIFNLNDSRIYNVSAVRKYSDSRDNNTSVQQTGVFRVSYMKSTTTSWNHSLSVTTGVTANWSSGIPFVGDFGVEITNERTESREWGVEKVEEETVEYEQTLVMPPRKKVTLNVTATEAYCDVPFSCDVRDTMTDGTIRTYTKTDGLFVGSNEYNFSTQITEDDL